MAKLGKTRNWRYHPKEIYMKKFIALIVIWILFVIFVVTRTVISNRSNKELDSFVRNSSTLRCGDQPSRQANLINAENPSLRRLGELEQKCGTSATSQLMIFTVMPKDRTVAKQLASQVAQTLVEFHNNQVTPLVVVEPTSDWGLIDFKEFQTGFYDEWINAFFVELKALGITDEMMGIWVPFPEANLPYWNHQNTSPSDFSANINRYVGILKKQFPKAKASILLNSATYPTDDFNWAQGEYLSLIPYVEGINKGLIDSFGLQGLPWMPSANQKGQPIFEPSEYLSQKMSSEAADYLGVKEIWFNTGTFAAKYTGEAEKKVIVPPSVRKQMLDKVIIEAEGLTRRGYNVTVNLFAEDKSQTAEATDWAYWGSEYTQNKNHESILLDFLKEIHVRKVTTSLFLR